MDINGNTVVVTGGASGLGKATAGLFAASGAKVAIFDMNEALGKKAAQELGVKFYAVDVADETSVIEGLTAAQRANGVARILVNCAGVAPAAKTLGRGNEPHSIEIYRRTIEVNLIGTFNMIAKFSAYLADLEAVKGERGVIVNTASIAAFDGQIGQAAYSASKGGIVGMTLPVARDLAPHQIRIVTVAPGLFLTPLLENFPQHVQDALGAMVPHPSRLGRPEEYAQMVESIVRNPMLNGEVIRLDGAVRLAPK